MRATVVELKKGNVELDGKVIMTFEKEVWGVHKIHLYDLSTEDELIEINNNDNETSNYFDDDFVQIRFLTTGDLVEMKMNKPFKKIIEWMIKKKVITEEGAVDTDKLELFVKNYDENITNRTVRY